MLRYTLILGLLLSLCFPATGQLSEGGTPRSFDFAKQESCAKIKHYKLPKLPIQRLLEEDGGAHADIQRVPYSKYRVVDIDIRKKGTTTPLDDGTLWRYNIVSKNALAIGLIFSSYELPEGAELFVYSSDRKIVYGAFTSKNNKKSGIFAIADLASKDIIIEYFEPKTAEFPGRLVLGQIGQVYRDTGDQALKVEGYVHVNCPEGDAIQLEKHAVAKMNFTISGVGYLCSGSLINNTANDGTPYFLTANHCISRDVDANTLITRFNYERVDCYGNATSQNLTLSGASLMATYAPSDMTLLLLDESPPVAYQAFFSGWNALDDSLLLRGGTSVHHPEGGLKRVSLEFNSMVSYPYEVSWDQGESTPPNTHWLVFFDIGATAGGSSGGPLFDANERIVGQLHGGGDNHELYGKLSTSWLGGGAVESSLKPWLDPDDSGVLLLDGYIPGNNNVEAIPMAQLTSPCINEPVQMLDGSLFNPTSWTWSFEPATVSYLEGTTSSSKDPVVAFLAEGDYDISLNVSKAGSSYSRTRGQYISAVSVLRPTITNYPDGIVAYCEFDTTTVFAGGADTYEWEVLSGGEKVLFDTSLFDDDHLIMYINDTVVVDSNFSVVLSLTGTHGACVETVIDTITFYYPYNDDIQNAQPVNMGMNGPFSNLCATVQENEPNPPEGDCNTQETWCGCEISDTIIDNSVWFSFVAPEAGIITINAPGFDNAIGLYAAASPEDIMTGNEADYTIIAANDDYFGADMNYSALINAAPVTPGVTYWIQVDGSACGATGEFYLELTDKGYNYLGVEDETKPRAQKLIVYPNPASEYLILHNLEGGSDITISLATADGKEVLSRKLETVESGKELQIDLPGDIHTGVYMLTVSATEYSHQTQILITK